MKKSRKKTSPTFNIIGSSKRTPNVSSLWGLFDSPDKAWIGNKSGPLLYDNERLAVAASLLANARLNEKDRIKPKRYKAQKLSMKDEVIPPLSLDQAYVGLKSGCIHDTNNDGDCHICYKSGGCPLKRVK